MSETTQRIPLAAARALADRLAALLAPACERVIVAGSIRREQPDVGDLELLCVPSVEYLGSDLWGNPTSVLVPLYDRLADLRVRGVLRDRPDRAGRIATGERYQRLIFGDVAADVFILRQPAQLGVLLAIRTGPSDFSKALVTQRRFGGLLPNDWRVRDGQLWDADGQALVTPDEETLFEAIGLDWIEPADRSWPLTTRASQCGCQRGWNGDLMFCAEGARLRRGAFWTADVMFAHVTEETIRRHAEASAAFAAHVRHLRNDGRETA